MNKQNRLKNKRTKKHHKRKGKRMEKELTREELTAKYYQLVAQIGESDYQITKLKEKKVELVKQIDSMQTRATELARIEAAIAKSRGVQAEVSEVSNPPPATETSSLQEMPVA